MFVDEDRLADEVRIFIESAFPKSIAQHDDRMRAGGAIVILCEQPAGPRPNTEHLVKVSTDELTADALRLIAVADVHLRAATRDHTGENGIAIAQILVHRI